MAEKIKNFDKLATNPLRKHALIIAEAGLHAIDTKQVIADSVHMEHKGILRIRNTQYRLADYQRVFCVAFGKAGFDAMAALEKVLGDHLTQGFVLSLTDGQLGPRVMVRTGTHPLPSPHNVEATEEMLRLFEGVTEKDLVICVVSGGGSALLCYPNQMTCEVENKIISQLTKAGADIFELNTVRKHISKVKGGYLAKTLYPATVASLIFSDVPGNDLSYVASGPTVKDTTTAHEAAAILKKYNILELCALPYCQISETPKDDKYFAQVNNFLVASAERALEAMKEKAKDLGYRAVVLPQSFSGEAKHLYELFKKQHAPHTCVIGAGETVVRIQGDGMGGRNQEAALAAVGKTTDTQIFVTLASDGRDNTDSAGALVDAATQKRASQFGVDAETYLANNDSFHFFEAVGDSVYTGNTGSNVSDLAFLLEG